MSFSREAERLLPAHKTGVYSRATDRPNQQNKERILKAFRVKDQITNFQSRSPRVTTDFSKNKSQKELDRCCTKLLSEHKSSKTAIPNKTVN